MKKFLSYALLSGAVMTMATSCSQEDIVMPGNDGNVTFQVSLPQDMGTRALGDGLSANSLRYAVYDTNDNLVTEGSASFSSGSLTTTVSLELATGVSYKVAFFAYKQYGSGIYSFSAADKSVTVDYEAMSGNMRYTDLDCFYTLQPVDVTDNMQPVSAVLYRPVAQVNWGTSDLASPAVTNAYRRVQTKLEATACTKFDLISGEATDPQDISISTSNLERQDKLNYAFPVEGYEYLNVMYLFAPKSDAALMDLTLQVYNYSDPVTSISVPNAPVERNFRTNIYGALLTNKFDITVEKSADWGGNNNLWQGDVQQPSVDAEGNYSVANAAQLAGLAQLINGGNSLEGKTVTLTSDIDLNNRNWTPMGTVANPFKGTFDGNGKTINNLNVTLGSTSVPAGLFGYVYGNAKVANLTVNNATINTLAATPANYGTGVIAGHAYSSVVFENNTVTNADIKAYRWAGGIAGKDYASFINNTVDGINIELSYEVIDGKYDNCDKAGAIIGYHGGEGAYKITGNKASNVTISGYRDIGGLCGMLNENDSPNCLYSDNTVTGGTITQNWAHPYSDGVQPGDRVGEMVGNLKADWHPSNNTASGVTLVIPEIAADAASFIADVKAGKNVVVNADMNLNLTDDLTVGDNATITVAEGKTLTLGSGRLDVTGKAVFMGSGKITGSGVYSLISNTPGSHIVIDGVTIENTQNNNYGGTVNTCADITVKSGVIKANNGSALVGNWTNGNSGVMNIEGGTFYNTGYGAYAVTAAGKGIANINGGEFFGNFGCFRTNSSAPGETTATINGGLFVCYGTGGAQGNYYAVAVDPATYNTGGVVTINGGEFWSANATLYARNTSTLTINGGMFKALNNYPVASGHTAQNVSIVKTVFNPATSSDLEIAFGVNVK